MKPLDRWPNRDALLDKSGVAPKWSLWFTMLVTVVQELQSHFRFGSGSPEGVETAPQGTVFVRDDGGVGTTVYAKSSGGIVTPTNTGWTALS